MVILDISDLGINVPVLIFQIVNFTALIFLLRLVLYKPILRLLDDRKERIRSGLAAAEQGREREAEANRAAQQQIDEARHEGQNIVAQAQQVAQRVQEEGRQQALVQSEAILERARGEIAQERDAAIAELRREFADLTVLAAERIVGQSLDRSAHERLINEALSQSSFRGN